jgi:hypothetical protein
MPPWLCSRLQQLAAYFRRPSEWAEYVPEGPALAGLGDTSALSLFFPKI